MGTDIHCAVERRDASGRWRFLEALDLGRNYDLFGILAGVRHREHKSIAPPRGLPSDLDPESRTRADPADYLGGADEFGDHSYSWLTLAELRAYDWNTLLTQTGVIPLRAVDWEQWNSGSHMRDPEPYEPYTEWRETPAHPPRSCSGGTSGTHTLDLRGGNAEDEALAERWIAHPGEMPEPEDPPPGAIFRDQTGGVIGWERGKRRHRVAYARVQWQVPAKDACDKFHAWLQRQDSAPDDLRIVFGFDS